MGTGQRTDELPRASTRIALHLLGAWDFLQGIINILIILANGAINSDLDPVLSRQIKDDIFLIRWETTTLRIVLLF